MDSRRGDRFDLVARCQAILNTQLALGSEMRSQQLWIAYDAREDAQPSVDADGASQER